jgi:antitoxin ParD1/3/4
MNVSLPPAMREWIEQLVAREGYGSASEYIRELVRRDQKSRARETVDARLLEALDSGPSAELTSADWAKLRKDLHARLARRGRKKAG